MKTLPQNFLNVNAKKWLSFMVTIEIEDSRGRLGNDTLHKM